MMSVIVSDSAGDMYVFSKGADTAILPLIRDQEGETYHDTSEHIERFAAKGMRTLVFAYKKLNEDCDVNKVDDAFLEQNLTLLGATGVEDVLQDEV